MSYVISIFTIIGFLFVIVILIVGAMDIIWRLRNTVIAFLQRRK